MEGSPRLTQTCRDALEAEERQVFISAISIWEVGMFAQRKRAMHGERIQRWIEDALSIRQLEVFELTPRVVCESMSLPDFKHNDPADRLIVATARVIGCPLITSDRKIVDYPHVKTIC